MQVHEIMTRDVELVSPDDTVQSAAKMMAALDTGILPVGENDRLIGCVTDRDIAIRAVAAGKSPAKCKIREIMSPGVKYVYEDETEEDVARNMGALQVRRLPVINREKRLVGIISMGDLAVRCGGAPAAQAMRRVSQPAT